MKFMASVQLDGKTATGITVPEAIIQELGGGKRPAVLVTINGHTYPSTLGVMKGVAKIPLSAQNRAAAKVSAGDEVEVELTLDTCPREVGLPADLSLALQNEPEASTFFASLSASNKKLFTAWIEAAKKPETRERRVSETLTKLRAGRTFR